MVAGFRVTLLAVTLLLGMLLAACGGNSGDGGSAGDDFPVPSGAEEVDKAGSIEDEDSLGFKLSDAGAAVYKTGDPIETVNEYYGGGVESDGWTISTNLPFGDSSFFVINKDKQVVYVNLQTGAAAKASPGLLEDDAIDVNVEDFADDETVIVLAHFDCDEDDVQVCLNVGQ